MGSQAWCEHWQGYGPCAKAKLAFPCSSRQVAGGGVHSCSMCFKAARKLCCYSQPHPHPLQVQISPQRPVAAPGGSLMEQVIYPSPLLEALADVDTHLLGHLLHQVGLAELLQRAQGDWMMSQDWQGACHVMFIVLLNAQAWLQLLTASSCGEWWLVALIWDL